VILPLLLAAAALPASAAPAPASGAFAAAGTVVRSKEWIVRRGKDPEEEFRGDVRYDSAGTHLSADWALFRHVEKVWRARGSVVLRRELKDGGEVTARGGSARYDEGARSGRLEPAPGERVTFTREAPGTEPDRGEGGRLDWTDDRVATLSGRARVWGPRLEAWADSAAYDRSDDRLILRGGRPVLKKVEGEWTTALKADEIEATESPRRIEARGGVTGWLVFKHPARLKELAK
jgi:hypothetical protein